MNIDLKNKSLGQMKEALAAVPKTHELAAKVVNKTTVLYARPKPKGVAHAWGKLTGKLCGQRIGAQMVVMDALRPYSKRAEWNAATSHIRTAGKINVKLTAGDILTTVDHIAGSISLDDVRHNSLFLEHKAEFVRFLDKRKAIENLACLEKVEAFNAMPYSEPEIMLFAAKQIYNLFGRTGVVGDDGQEQGGGKLGVNLTSAADRKKFDAAYKKATEFQKNGDIAEAKAEFDSAFATLTKGANDLLTKLYREFQVSEKTARKADKS